jgi:hypothetical protein
VKNEAEVGSTGGEKGIGMRREMKGKKRRGQMGGGMGEVGRM